LNATSIGGSVVECSPATRAARVRFPADAHFCLRVCFRIILRASDNATGDRQMKLERSGVSPLRKYSVHRFYYPLLCCSCVLDVSGQPALTYRCCPSYSQVACKQAKRRQRGKSCRNNMLTSSRASISFQSLSTHSASGANRHWKGL
jgi:hypothetical protein